MSEVFVTILAGGQGARFWPISRATNPKQFLSINNSGESLIQATARRMKPLIHDNELYVVTNDLHRELVNKHVPDANIISEPIAKNTAAAIGLAAIKLAKISPESVMLVLPADHAVADEAKLIELYRQAIDLASKEKLLVTLGIKPVTPNTGYGYIKRGKQVSDGSYYVDRFYEKPNAQRAQDYLDSGEYFWNSGMFIWRVDSILEAIEMYMPELHQGLLRIKAALGSTEESNVILEVFSSLESISIDFGVLEHARNCAVIIADGIGWNDVGAWDAWAEHFKPDQSGNLLHGDAMAIDSKNCIIHSENRLTAVLGLEGAIIIDSGDAVMVCSRDHAQDVKKIVEMLKSQGRKDLI